MVVVSVVGWGEGGEGGGPKWLLVRVGGVVAWVGVGCCPAPQSMPRRGYLSVVFCLFFFPEDGVWWLLSSTNPVLFLGGDLANPLSRLICCLISCTLLLSVFSFTQLFTLSSLSSPSSSSTFSSLLSLGLLSSFPRVNRPMVQRLYSPLEFRTTSSPHLCISTASCSDHVQIIPSPEGGRVEKFKLTPHPR